MEPGGGHLKKLCVLMALALSLSLGGCGLSGGRSAAELPPPPAQSPSIQRSELSGEEYAAAELLGAQPEDWQIFDIATGDGTQALELTVWQLSGGTWEVFSSDRVGCGGSYGRLAVKLDDGDPTLEYALQLGSGGVRLSPTQLAERSEGESWGATFLNGERSADADEPVAVMLASGSRGNSHKLYLPDAGFAEPELFGSEFTGVFALTVEFCSTM